MCTTSFLHPGESLQEMLGRQLWTAMDQSLAWYTGLVRAAFKRVVSLVHGCVHPFKNLSLTCALHHSRLRGQQHCGPNIVRQGMDRGDILRHVPSEGELAALPRAGVPR
jgi:hypothetical protein